MARGARTDDGTELNRLLLDQLFEELDQELAKTNTQAELYLVGGARMAYDLNPARRTMDVDAVFRRGQSEVEAAAARLQGRHGLRTEWLNEGARGMMPAGRDNDEVPLFAGKHLRVVGASPRRMLALKVSSLRDKDWKDIKPLMTATGATTFGQVKTLVEDEYKTAGPGAAALLRLRLPELERGLDQKKHETSWRAEQPR